MNVSNKRDERGLTLKSMAKSMKQRRRTQNASS